MSEPRYRYLKTRTERGVLVLTPTPSRLEGDELAQQLTDDMLAAVAHVDAKRVVVNLEHVAYLTSANFRPLLALRKKLGPDGRVVLCSLTKTLLDIFETTKMVGSGGSSSSRALFTGRPDEDSAVAAALEDAGRRRRARSRERRGPRPCRRAVRGRRCSRRTQRNPTKGATQACPPPILARPSASGGESGTSGCGT